MNAALLEFEGTDLLMLRAARTCAAIKDVRHYLNGVHFTTQHVESSNGACAARFDMPMQAAPTSGLDVIIPKFKIAAGTQKALITVDGEMAEIQEIAANGAETRTSYRVIDGTFPDLSRILPTDATRKSLDVLAFNPPLIADICKATKLKGGVKLEAHGEGDAFTVRFPNMPDLMFCCMPMKL